jgi:hypothetical protein
VVHGFQVQGATAIAESRAFWWWRPPARRVLAVRRCRRDWTTSPRWRAWTRMRLSALAVHRLAGNRPGGKAHSASARGRSGSRRRPCARRDRRCRGPVAFGPLRRRARSAGPRARRQPPRWRSRTGSGAGRCWWPR